MPIRSAQVALSLALTISLAAVCSRAGADEVEVLSDGAKRIAAGTREFTVTLERNQTKLYRLSGIEKP